MPRSAGHFIALLCCLQFKFCFRNKKKYYENYGNHLIKYLVHYSSQLWFLNMSQTGNLTWSCVCSVYHCTIVCSLRGMQPDKGLNRTMVYQSTKLDYRPLPCKETYILHITSFECTLRKKGSQCNCFRGYSIIP